LAADVGWRQRAWANLGAVGAPAEAMFKRDGEKLPAIGR
jgi:hypothetical protein